MHRKSTNTCIDYESFTRAKTRTPHFATRASGTFGKPQPVYKSETSPQSTTFISTDQKDEQNSNSEEIFLDIEGVVPVLHAKHHQSPEQRPNPPRHQPQISDSLVYLITNC